jgi:predicted MFS family arabinose efflux permease
LPLVISLLTAVAVARLVPAETPSGPAPSASAEFAALRSRPLLLTLATCAAVNAGVLSIYSFIAPLLIDRAGLPDSFVPLALVLFGVAALVGSLVGGWLGAPHPFATPLGTAAITLIASALLCAFSTWPAPALLLFTLLGLVGLSANPVLVNLAVRYGGAAPTLASAMATSCFNLGIAVGTWITGMALQGRLGALGVPVVGTVFAATIFLPFGALLILQRRATETAPRLSSRERNTTP